MDMVSETRTLGAKVDAGDRCPAGVAGHNSSDRHPLLNRVVEQAIEF